MRKDAIEKKNQIKDEKRMRAALNAYVFIMAAMIVVFTVILYVQYDKKIKTDYDIARLESEIEKENKKGEELKKLLANRDSDEYIEKMAREQLGYVKPNEIIYVDKNK